MPLLMTPSELVELRASAQNVRVLDVRWRLDRPDGRAEYLEGHVPGAVYVDFDRELARHGAPHEGRHPLPETPVLQDAARRWGLDDGDVVVVYDDFQSMAAARAWWLLSFSGVADVRVLDGGLPAWRDAGLPFEQGDVRAARGSVALSPLSAPIADIDDAAAWPGRGVLIDARAPERYRGEVEPYDPVAGHVPGAVNVPMSMLIQDDGRFRDPDGIRSALASAGATRGPGPPCRRRPPRRRGAPRRRR